MNPALEDLIRSGIYSPPPLGNRGSHLSWSGASIFGATITLATISKTVRGRLKFDSQRSLQFQLPKRDQACAQRLYAALKRFTQQARIRQVFLRTGARGTQHQARVEAHICEGVLYLVPNVSVHQVSAFTLGPWMQNRGIERSRDARRAYWQTAMAAALYAAEQEGLDITQQLQLGDAALALSG